MYRPDVYTIDSRSQGKHLENRFVVNASPCTGGRLLIQKCLVNVWQHLGVSEWIQDLLRKGLARFGMPDSRNSNSLCTARTQSDSDQEHGHRDGD